MNASTAFLRRVAQAPLARFVALGALIFALYAAVDDTPPPAAPDAITLDVAGAQRLAARFEATWRRPPTPEELAALMRDWTIEEAFVREGRALGLDRDDAVVRQRLRQKMVFFAETGAGDAEPDDATLQAHMDANAARFETPPRLSFEQIYLGEAAAPDAVSAIRAALEAGADPATLGAPTLLPAALPLVPESVVQSAFGPGFFARASALEPGVWSGPVDSTLGVHLVRVTAREPARRPPLEQVRERVASDWRAARAQALLEAYTESLLARSRVELPDPAAVLAQ